MPLIELHLRFQTTGSGLRGEGGETSLLQHLERKQTMGVSNYRELKVWQCGIELSESIYRLTVEFPKHELYGLTSQMRRSVVSVPSNIAEGHSRESTKEYLHHLSFALGSLAELETQITIAERLRYLPGDLAAAIVEKCDHIGRMLRNLQRSLRLRLRRKRSDNSGTS